MPGAAPGQELGPAGASPALLHIPGGKYATPATPFQLGKLRLERSLA